MVSLILAVYAASLLIFPASAVSILASLDDLTKSEFDFVVVGGGTAVKSLAKLGYLYDIH